MSRPHLYTYVERERIDVPGGKNDAWWITHSSYGKESHYSEDSRSPYLLANEWIAGCLAQYLRIPVPPFSVMKLGRKDRPMFTSLQFTPSRTAPPDMKPSKCWQANKYLCTGIVLFDILIGNDDRAPRNIAVDNPMNPQEIICHDHECAIASDLYGDALSRFRKKFDQFLAKNHCLIREMDTDDHLNEWIGRIQSIPPWFIKEICQEAKTKGFGPTVASAAADFLCWRKEHIDALIRDNREEFEGINVWRKII